MAASGTPLTLPTQILPSFLLAVGVGGSVHILAIFYQARRRGDSKEDAIAFALGHSGLAVVMTSLTTGGGLVSFIAAELRPISHFGVFAPTGVMVALIFTLVLLPALIAVFPMREERQQGSRRPALSQRLLVRTGEIATRHAGITTAVWGTLLLLAIVGTTRIHLSHSPFEWFPEGHPVRVASDLMNDRMNGSAFAEFVIETGQENGLHDPDLLMRLDEIARHAATIRQDDMYVGKTLSLADVVKEIHQALNENRADYYAIPDDRMLVAQELLLFENSGSDDLEDFVDPRFESGRVTMKLPFRDAVQLPPLYEELRESVERILDGRAEFTLTGMAVVAGETIVAVMHTMLRSYAIALLIITPLLVLLIGNLRIGLVAMIPNLTPILITLGLMGWAGIPLDTFTMLIGSIAIGLAVDDTIHFMHNFRRYYARSGDVHQSVRETLSTTGQALLFTSLVLSTGFILYTFATMEVLFNFGLLTALTIVTAFLADIVLAPALMVLVAHRQPTGLSAPISMETSS
jgi:predicted RND superfamily exporter protein